MSVELLLDYNLYQHTGRVRERNEDRCLAGIPTSAALRAERGRLFVVADGMGGHAAGDVAAQAVVDTVRDAYYHAGRWTDPARQLRWALRCANLAVREAAREAGHQGMGAAVVAVAVLGRHAVVAHMGDCRVYLIRAGAPRRLTADHSWVQERITAGAITAAEAKHHPYRNMLTRAIGATSAAEPESSALPLRLGDLLLLCSDGLWGQVTDEELAAVATAAPDATAAVIALIDLALDRGAPDNVSAIVVRVVGPVTDVPTERLSTGT